MDGFIYTPVQVQKLDIKFHIYLEHCLGDLQLHLFSYADNEPFMTLVMQRYPDNRDFWHGTIAIREINARLSPPPQHQKKKTTSTTTSHDDASNLFGYGCRTLWYAYFHPDKMRLMPDPVGLSAHPERPLYRIFQHARPFDDCTNTSVKKPTDLVIYEVLMSAYVHSQRHNGSQIDSGDMAHTYLWMADHVKNIRAMGFNAVQFMPLQQYPPIYGDANSHDRSWAGGYYAQNFGLNTRLGTLDDFRALVRAIHAAGMRVILDVVTEHTATEGSYLSLHEIDPALFQTNRITEWHTTGLHVDTRKPAWRTYIYSALAQMFRELGIDGVRMDAFVEGLGFECVKRDFPDRCIIIEPPNCRWGNDHQHQHPHGIDAAHNPTAVYNVVEGIRAGSLQPFSDHLTRSSEHNTAKGAHNQLITYLLGCHDQNFTVSQPPESFRIGPMARQFAQLPTTADITRMCRLLYALNVCSNTGVLMFMGAELNPTCLMNMRITGEHSFRHINDTYVGSADTGKARCLKACITRCNAFRHHYSALLSCHDNAVIACEGPFAAFTRGPRRELLVVVNVSAHALCKSIRAPHPDMRLLLDSHSDEYLHADSLSSGALTLNPFQVKVYGASWVDMHQPIEATTTQHKLEACDVQSRGSSRPFGFAQKTKNHIKTWMSVVWRKKN